MACMRRRPSSSGSRAGAVEAANEVSAAPAPMALAVGVPFRPAMFSPPSAAMPAAVEGLSKPRSGGGGGAEEEEWLWRMRSGEMGKGERVCLEGCGW